MNDTRNKFKKNLRHISIRKKTASRICAVQVLYSSIAGEKDLDIAKKALHGKAKFLLCDCLDMKLDDKTIDIVLSNQVIEHITDYEKYISEIKRILREKGLLIISTPNLHLSKKLNLKLM